MSEETRNEEDGDKIDFIEFIRSVGKIEVDDKQHLKNRTNKTDNDDDHSAMQKRHNPDQRRTEDTTITKICTESSPFCVRKLSAEEWSNKHSLRQKAINNFHKSTFHSLDFNDDDKKSDPPILAPTPQAVQNEKAAPNMEPPTNIQPVSKPITVTVGDKNKGLGADDADLVSRCPNIPPEEPADPDLQSEGADGQKDAGNTMSFFPSLAKQVSKPKPANELSNKEQNKSCQSTILLSIEKQVIPPPQQDETEAGQSTEKKVQTTKQASSKEPQRNNQKSADTNKAPWSVEATQHASIKEHSVSGSVRTDNSQTSTKGLFDNTQSMSGRTVSSKEKKSDEDSKLHSTSVRADATQCSEKSETEKTQYALPSTPTQPLEDTQTHTSPLANVQKTQYTLLQPVHNVSETQSNDASGKRREEKQKDGMSSPSINSEGVTPNSTGPSTPQDHESMHTLRTEPGEGVKG